MKIICCEPSAASVYSLMVNLPTVSPMRLIALLTALLWSLVANHCYLSVALAAPAPAAHDCHDKRTHGNGIAHDGWPIKVCCEKITRCCRRTRTWDDTVDVARSAEYAPAERRASDVLLLSRVRCWTIQAAVGPPSKILLLSLSLAPNAPPR